MKLFNSCDLLYCLELASTIYNSPLRSSYYYVPLTSVIGLSSSFFELSYMTSALDWVSNGALFDFNLAISNSMIF